MPRQAFDVAVRSFVGMLTVLNRVKVTKDVTYEPAVSQHTSYILVRTTLDLSIMSYLSLQSTFITA